MKAPRRFRVWCLSWDEDEEHGCDVVAYDIFGAYPRGQRGVVHVPSTVLHDAAAAAEAYADYVHDNRDGNESSWPLTFRVRDADGAITDFEVYRDYVTEFSAAPVKPVKLAETDVKEDGLDELLGDPITAKERALV